MGGIGETRFYRSRLLIDCPRTTALRARPDCRSPDGRRIPIEAGFWAHPIVMQPQHHRGPLTVQTWRRGHYAGTSALVVRPGAFRAHEDRHHGRSGIDRDFSDQRSTSSREHMICTRLRLFSLDISMSSLLHIEAEKLGLDYSGSHLVKRCIFADVNNSWRFGIRQ